MSKNYLRSKMLGNLRVKRYKVTKKGSIISVVGKTTVEIIELFKCTQKVP